MGYPYVCVTFTLTHLYIYIYTCACGNSNMMYKLKSIIISISLDGKSKKIKGNEKQIICWTKVVDCWIVRYVRIYLILPKCCLPKIMPPLIWLVGQVKWMPPSTLSVVKKLIFNYFQCLCWHICTWKTSLSEHD